MNVAFERIKKFEVTVIIHKKCGNQFNSVLSAFKDGIEIVSCPTCGRTSIDLIGLAGQVEKMAERYADRNLKIAVMGCAVNGPGEAREADIGIAGGQGEGLLIKRGKIVRKMKEEYLLAALKEELDNWQG